MLLEKESDSAPPNERWPELPVRDDLEFLRLLGSGSVQRGGGEQTHVIRLLMKLHQFVYEPRGRRGASGLVLERYDNKEASPWSGEPTLSDQPLRRALHGHR
jgi:hypothetical protein